MAFNHQPQLCQRMEAMPKGVLVPAYCQGFLKITCFLFKNIHSLMKAAVSDRKFKKTFMYILKLLTGQLQTFLLIIMNTDRPNDIVIESFPFTRQKILFLFGNIGPKAIIYISFFVFSCKKGFKNALERVKFGFLRCVGLVSCCAAKSEAKLEPEKARFWGGGGGGEGGERGRGSGL